MKPCSILHSPSFEDMPGCHKEDILTLPACPALHRALQNGLTAGLRWAYTWGLQCDHTATHDRRLLERYTAHRLFESQGLCAESAARRRKRTPCCEHVHCPAFFIRAELTCNSDSLWVA